jgi:putative RecB family exonuclease
VLEAQHIRPLGDDAKEKALLYTCRFNRIEGPSVYPRIRDTEHLLQKDTGKYIMHGVVDVLASSPAGAGLERPASLEIWDYKGARLPDPNHGDRDLKNYQFQMRVYAHLYKLRWNVAPARAVLWFLAEDPPSSGRLEVDITPTLVDEAVRVFEATVSEIDNSIESDTWPAPSPEKRPSPETCDACDVRWGCPAHKNKPYRIRTIGPHKERH